ncbi:sensor domain-containing diguanylate cyclase [Bacillus tianshenii]|nr:sensor domain-containing diguanylate cyclase [Bacillus tianshenii]
MTRKKGIKLRFALSILVIMSVICSAIVGGIVAKSALNNSLKANYLESNYNYAKKLAASTSDLFHYMQQNINALADISSYHSFSQRELDGWKNANEMFFNSLFITDEHGVIQTISPKAVQFKGGAVVQAGIEIKSKPFQKALALKKPFISEPYKATSGQMIVLVSSPIFDKSGVFKGVMAGTVYLESDNAIKNILNEQQLENGSYVYVVNKEGQLVYHPDVSRIAESVAANKVVQQLMQGNSGSAQVVNTQGKEFFSGYIYEENSKWGIVSQTPTSVIEEPLNQLMFRMSIQALPLLLLILVIVWYLANHLTKPINTLAKFSEDATDCNKPSIPLERLDIDSNIYEIRQLCHHIKNHFHLLNKEIEIDGLTGLANRKAFDRIIDDYVEQRTPFALLLLDIDHFKSVNDTYGHLVGDEVLKLLAVNMPTAFREEDVCFRYGGEEFGVLIKDCNEAEACGMAEALRKQVEKMSNPTGEHITISIGVTSFYDDDIHPKAIIERADAALYQSKEKGRNRTTIYKAQSYPAVAAHKR